MSMKTHTYSDAGSNIDAESINSRTIAHMFKGSGPHRRADS